MLSIPDSAITIVQKQSIFTDMRIEQFLQDTLFTWQWWLLIVLFIVPWIVWFCVIDKKRLTAIVLLGMFTLATSSWMDDLGTDMILWYYPYKLIPIYPQLVPINYSIMPVTFMLIYQYNPLWDTYVKTLVLMSTAFSFIAEPALVYLGMYKLLAWKYHYSFPIYIVMGIAFRWIVEKIFAINKMNSQQ